MKFDRENIYPSVHQNRKTSLIWNLLEVIIAKKMSVSVWLKTVAKWKLQSICPEKLAYISISPLMLRPAIEKDLNDGQNSIIWKKLLGAPEISSDLLPAIKKHRSSCKISSLVRLSLASFFRFARFCCFFCFTTAAFSSGVFLCFFSISVSSVIPFWMSLRIRSS